MRKESRIRDKGKKFEKIEIIMRILNFIYFFPFEKAKIYFEKPEKKASSEFKITSLF